MTTFASPRLTKRTLQILISLVFLSGSYMIIVSIIRTINYVGHISRIQNNDTINLSEKNEDDGSMLDKNEQDDEEIVTRFPNISSLSVQLLLGLVTFCHGILGIVAIAKERTSLISSYSYVLFISCFVKLLFIIASLIMYTTASSQTLLTSISVFIVLTSMIEIILMMCVCQFGKLVKRGDAARQEIQSIHSYHLKRSRSKSQSGMRSLRGNSPFLSGCPTPIMINSSPNSRAVSVMSTMVILDNDNDSTSYYVPPAIYLKLDR